MAEKNYFIKKFPKVSIKYFKLPTNLQGCLNCSKCNKDCNFKDRFQEIADAIENASDVMLGSPVYFDMPTPQIVAFLTRLNCKAENTEREFFKDKRIHLLTTSFCSGTK